MKNPVLAKLLGLLGSQVKAELNIDDSNGTALMFPDIDDVAQIAEGVAVSAPDGTYTIADGDNAITIEVLGGVVVAYTLTTPTAEVPTDAPVEVDAEVLEVLTAAVNAVKKADEKATEAGKQVVALKKELADLKKTLSHDDANAGAAAQKKNVLQFRTV